MPTTIIILFCWRSPNLSRHPTHVDVGSRGHSSGGGFHATCSKHTRGTPNACNTYECFAKEMRTNIWAIRCDIGLYLVVDHLRIAIGWNKGMESWRASDLVCGLVSDDSARCGPCEAAGGKRNTRHKRSGIECVWVLGGAV